MAGDSLDRNRAIRRALAANKSSWDEIAMTLQLMVRGVLLYAPLIGLPSPMDLADEDSAFQLLVLSGLRTRCTACSVKLFKRGVSCDSALHLTCTFRSSTWL